MIINKWIEKIFLGNPKKKEINRLKSLVEKVNKEYEKLKYLSDLEWSNKVSSVKNTHFTKDEKTLVTMLAIVKYACVRLSGEEYKVMDKTEIWNMIPYDVQIIGAIALLEGKISEMKTGEGKTLVAGMVASIVAFSGKGVHVITVNDYLAKRDLETNLPLFEILGLSTGVIINNSTAEERKNAYSFDITYGTNNEFGFDYLRDNMARSLNSVVQRDLHFALVDEVDSILIDESRTPLIISAPAGESTNKYKEYAILVNKLKEADHFTIDEKQKTAILTEEGISKMENLLNIKNIYTERGYKEVHHIEQALRANACFKKDTDYIVDNKNGVVIVDEFTGRLMPGRRFSDGLHQALEAKENVEIKQQSKTMASITFQNYFRLYTHLAGMTGTAETEEEEFANIYKLPVLPVPTNKPVTRIDHKDFVYKNEVGKFTAIAKLLKEKYEKGQPVLIGTSSIEKSEYLSIILKQYKVPHNVLNAKFHEKEAEIIAAAGQKKSITIATNMAGRGTDIKLGEGVKDLGGLFIVGSERHESRRIDNQLRGRSGRQGDIGETRFFVSLEDSLMRMFGSDKLLGMMNAINLPDDLPIENGFISKGIENAQKRVEGLNFDRRKHVLQYDDIMNKQREIIYTRRRNILKNIDLHGEFLSMIREEVKNIVEVHTANRESHKWGIKEIYEDIISFHKDEAMFNYDLIKKSNSVEEISILCIEFLTNIYKEKRKYFKDEESVNKILLQIGLRVIDSLFVEHLQTMTNLKEQVSLQAYGQRDPLMEYKKEAYHLFTKLIFDIRKGNLSTFFHIEIETNFPKPINQKLVTNEEEIENNLNSKEIKDNKSLPPIPKKETPKAKTKAPKGVTVIRVEDDNSSEEKVGRNDPCPCGSGKKFKKCCG
jgi:preprotein translocase subunit SecA